MKKLNLQSFSVKLILFAAIVPTILMVGMNLTTFFFVQNSTTQQVDSHLQSIGDGVANLISASSDSLNTSENEKYSAYDGNIRDQVYAAYRIIADFYNRSQYGEFNESVAKQYAANSIVAMRYGSTLSGYLWINDFNNMMVAHGVNPALNGVDFSTVNDSKGTLFVPEFVKICQNNATNNEGYFDYYFFRPGATVDSPKRAFVKGFLPWEWVIATGNYVDDIQDSIDALKFTMLDTIRSKSADMAPTGGYIAAFDSNGITRIHPEQSELGILSNATNELTDNYIRYEVLNQTTGVYLYKYNGVAKRAYLEHIHSEKFDYYIMVAVSQSEVQKQVSAITNIIFIILGVSAVVMLSIGIVLSINLNKPVASLKEGAVKIGEGDLSVDLKLDRKDEFGELSIVFDDMIVKVKDQQEKIRTIIDSTTAPLVISDEKQIIQDVGLSFIQLSGFKREDLIGQNLAILFKDPKELEIALDMFRRTGEIRNMEIQLKNNYNKAIFIEISTIELKGESGKSFGRLSTTNDVTNQR
ncbi:MAG: cache domain-containing protein, partial [Promethearchaeota archaeon]